METVALGKRIKAHRVAAGLSLRQLAQRLTVSAQALSQYETGKIRPRPEVLGALAEVLGTRVEQLERPPDGVTLGAVHIRDPNRRRRRMLGKAQGSLVSLTERSLSLEQRLGGAFPSPSLPLMHEIRPMRVPEDAERLAQDVRRRWGLGTGALPSVVSLFEARGVRVFELLHDEDRKKFTACSAFVSFSGASWSDFPVIILNGALWGEQKRFALCHELAHMILPSLQRYILSPDVRGQLANWFASALLLPATALRDQVGRRRRTLSWYELTEVKRQFGVSYETITHRCRHIGIITRETYRGLLEEYRRLGWSDAPYREHMAFSPRTESSTRLRRLALRAVTEGIVAPQEAAALLDIQEERLDAWLDPPATE